MKIYTKTFDELTARELYFILKLRSEVFVLEQECLYEDMDNFDLNALHVWIEQDGEIAAYLRVLDRGVESEYVSLGRVVSRYRRRGLGSILLAEGIRAAKSFFGADIIYIEAQSYVKSFYEKHGFEQISDEFMLDNIPHIRMIKNYEKRAATL